MVTVGGFLQWLGGEDLHSNHLGAGVAIATRGCPIVIGGVAMATGGGPMVMGGLVAMVTVGGGVPLLGGGEKTP